LVGDFDGSVVGLSVGLNDSVGCDEGDIPLGSLEGNNEGYLDGKCVGSAEGCSVGMDEGAKVRLAVGEKVGFIVCGVFGEYESDGLSVGL